MRTYYMPGMCITSHAHCNNEKYILSFAFLQMRKLRPEGLNDLPKVTEILKG